MRLDKVIARGRIIDLRSTDLEGALQELVSVAVAKFPDLRRLWMHPYKGQPPR